MGMKIVLGIPKLSFYSFHLLHILLEDIRIVFKLRSRLEGIIVSLRRMSHPSTLLIQVHMWLLLNIEKVTKHISYQSNETCLCGIMLLSAFSTG